MHQHSDPDPMSKGRLTSARPPDSMTCEPKGAVALSSNFWPRVAAGTLHFLAPRCSQAGHTAPRHHVQPFAQCCPLEHHLHPALRTCLSRTEQDWPHLHPGSHPRSQEEGRDEASMQQAWAALVNPCRFQDPVLQLAMHLCTLEPLSAFEEVNL